MKYQVGRLTNFHADDPVFDEYKDAIECALKKNKEDKWSEVPIAVWASQEDGSELLAIICEGTTFTPYGGGHG
jgi:hypothetical protein